ncbi:hypothetical protein MMC22_004517 [Lobaria immixta]|nr:hypothetical protein [Lobaria immixta]
MYPALRNLTAVRSPIDILTWAKQAFKEKIVQYVLFIPSRMLQMWSQVCSSPERLCYNCKQPGNALTLTLCYGRILNVFLTALQDMNQTGARSPVRLKVRARTREEAVWGAQR